MTNFDVVENAIQTAQNSSGSAMAENEKFLNSIAGKQQALTRSTQEFWNKMINSNVIKYFLDVAQAAVNAANAFGPWKTTLAAIVTYFMAVKKTNPVSVFKGFVDQINAYGNASKTLSGLSSIFDVTDLNKTKDDAYRANAITAYATAVKSLTFEKQAAMLANQGLSASNIEEALTTNGATEADIKAASVQAILTKQRESEVVANEALVISSEMIAAAKDNEAISNFLVANSGQVLNYELVQEAVKHGEITAETAAEIAAKYGLVAANTGLATSINGIGTAIRLAMSSNPVGFILMVITTVLSLIPLLGKLHKSTEDISKEAEQIKTEYSNATSEIKNNISTIKGLESEFNKLSKGVGDNGENISLSADDYARYQEIVQQLVGISPSLVAGYDREGNAIANKNSLIERSIELMEEEQRLKAQQFIENDAATVKDDIDNRAKSLKKKKQSQQNADIFKVANDFRTFVDDFETRELDNGKTAFDIYSEFVDDVKAQSYLSSYGASDFFEQNFDAIVADLKSADSKLAKYLTEDQVQQLSYYADLYSKNVVDFDKQLHNVYNEYNDLLMQYIEGSYAFNDLDDGLKGNILTLALNVDINDEDFEYKKDEILEFIEFASQNQDLLNATFTSGKKAVSTVDENGNSLNYKSYIENINKFKSELQSSGAYNDDQQNWILKVLGIDKDTTELEISKQVDHVKNMIDSESVQLESKIDSITDRLQSKIKKKADEYNRNVNGNVDYNKRKNISPQKMFDAGWNDDNDIENIKYADMITTYSQGFHGKDVNTSTKKNAKAYIEVTPILNNGEVLSPEELDKYVGELFASDDILKADTKGIVIDIEPNADAENYYYRKQNLLDMIKSDHSDYTLALEKWNELVKESENPIEDFKKVLKTDFPTINIDDILKFDGADDAVEKYLDSLPIEDIELLCSVSVDPNSFKNIDEVNKFLADLRKQKEYDVQEVFTTSKISTSIDNYKSALEQTNEVIGKGTIVTDDYKEALVALGASEEELNDCFYDSNKNMIKNEKGLKKILDSTKKNINSNIKLAKAQAGLKYYNLVKEMGKAITGKKQFDAVTKQNINDMLQEADSVRQSIIQYQRLQDEINGTQNAFNKFNKAKEIDALNVNPDTFIEAVNLMQNTIKNTGEFGTESFWAAVDMTIPPEVYSKIEGDTDKVKAIIEYFNSDVKKLLTIDGDEIKLDFNSMEKFFNAMKDANLLTSGSTLEDWSFATEQNLESVAKALGMTVDQTKAMFDEMDKYNTNREALPLSLQLDNSIEGRVLKLTSELDELQREKIQLLSDDGGYDKNKEQIDEINNKINELSNSTRTLGEEARVNIADNLKIDAAIEMFSKLKAESDAATVSIQDLHDMGLDNLGIAFDVDSNGLVSVQEVIDRLLEKKNGLETPTQMTAQFAIDEIDQQIASIQSRIDGMNAGELTADIDGDSTSLQAEIDALQAEKLSIAAQYNIEVDDTEVNTVMKEMQDMQSFTFNGKTLTITTNSSSVWQEISRIQNYTLPRKKQYIDVIKTGATELLGTAHINGTAYSSGTAYAGGQWGAPKTETALVGELGRELVKL